MEENKKKEPKLRVIRAPQSVEPFVNSTSNTGYGCGWSDGFGTSPEDCMSYDHFNILCKNGALKSEVYVCGFGKRGCPQSSSSSSGWSSSSGSGSSGSSGSCGSIVSGGGYEWESWPEWYGWDNFSGSNWCNYGSSLSYEDKLDRLELVRKQVVHVFGQSYPVRIVQESDKGCRGNAKFENGEIIVCYRFFEYNQDDQINILWHEFYHMEHRHNGYAGQNEKITLNQSVILQPDEKMKECVSRQIKYDYECGNISIGSTEQEEQVQQELKIDAVHPAQWYRNEIETYKAEIKNGLPKTERYLCEERWLLWKYEQCLRIAEKYE